MKNVIKKLKENKKALVGTILLGIVAISGITYALWQRYFVGSESNRIATGCFNVTFTESTGILRENAVPLSEEEGMETRPYTVTIKNTCNIAAGYQVNIETLNSNTLEARFIRSAIDTEKSELLSKLPSTNVTLKKNGKEAFRVHKSTLQPGAEVTHDIRMWMDEKTTLENATNEDESMKKIDTKVTVIATPTTADFNDIKLAVFVDGIEKSAFPEKDSGYKYDEAFCNNDVNIKWDYSTWTMQVENLKQPTNCNLYFVKGDYVADYGNEIPPLRRNDCMPLFSKADGLITSINTNFGNLFSYEQYGNCNIFTSIKFVQDRANVISVADRTITQSGWQAADKVYNFPHISDKNSWIVIFINGSGYTGALNYITNFRLILNSNQYTIRQAVDSKLIEPLVLFNSQGAYGVANRGFTDLSNLVNLGNAGNGTTDGSYSRLNILLKTKNTQLSGIRFNAKVNSSGTDGYIVWQLPSDFDLSLTPFK